HRPQRRALLDGRPVAGVPHACGPGGGRAGLPPHRGAGRPPEPPRAQRHRARLGRAGRVARLAAADAPDARTLPGAPVLRRPDADRGRPRTAGVPPQGGGRAAGGTGGDRRPARGRRRREHAPRRHARERHRPRQDRTRLARDHPAATGPGDRMSTPTAAALDRIAARYDAKPAVASLRLAVEQPSTGFRWRYGDADRPYFIASITKLFTVAAVMQLRDEGALTLETPAASLLGERTMRGLNTHGGRDHGAAITVRELLAQTSGIPDYFEQERADGTTFLDDALRADAAWTFEDFIASARRMPSR